MRRSRRSEGIMGSLRGLHPQGMHYCAISRRHALPTVDRLCPPKNELQAEDHQASISRCDEGQLRGTKYSTEYMRGSAVEAEDRREVSRCLPCSHPWPYRLAPTH